MGKEKKKKRININKKLLFRQAKKNVEYQERTACRETWKSWLDLVTGSHMESEEKSS